GATRSDHLQLVDPGRAVGTGLLAVDDVHAYESAAGRHRVVGDVGGVGAGLDHRGEGGAVVGYQDVEVTRVEAGALPTGAGVEHVELRDARPRAQFPLEDLRGGARAELVGQAAGDAAVERLGRGLVGVAGRGAGRRLVQRYFVGRRRTAA